MIVAFSAPKAIDVIFGSKTRSAVRTFKRQNNLQVDGVSVSGPQTFQMLFKCKKISRGFSAPANY
ncbi:peptidoglycan-binding protein [Bacillus sp. A301a_S52]|jgi:peptidoglycan hydrolase-like protein with peptidoglycan-binding domain|nr:peptidoglycan-binding protein [Bacillus sp. A301a_S52]